MARFLKSIPEDIYVLFAVDHFGNLVFQEDASFDAFGVDWDPVRIVQVTPTAVSLTPPSLFFRGAGCTMSGKIIAFSREELSPVFLCQLGPSRVYVYLLRDMKQSFVFALGLS